MEGIRHGLRHGDLTRTLIKLEYFMPTPSNTKIQSLQHCGHLLWEYSFYVRQELRNPVIYLTSAVIGLLAIWMMNAPSIIPFLVPWISSNSRQCDFAIQKQGCRYPFAAAGPTGRSGFYYGLSR